MTADGRTTGPKSLAEVDYGSCGRPDSGVFTGAANPMNFVIVLLPWFDTQILPLASSERAYASSRPASPPIPAAGERLVPGTAEVEPDSSERYAAR